MCSPAAPPALNAGGDGHLQPCIPIPALPCLLLKVSFPPSAGVTPKSGQSPILKCPTDFPLILWHPYARHYYFCVMTGKEQEKWRAVFQDCVRHCNNGERCWGGTRTRGLRGGESIVLLLQRGCWGTCGGWVGFWAKGDDLEVKRRNWLGVVEHHRASHPLSERGWGAGGIQPPGASLCPASSRCP